MLIARARPWKFEQFYVFDGNIIVGEIIGPLSGNRKIISGDEEYSLDIDNHLLKARMMSAGKPVACAAVGTHAPDVVVHFLNLEFQIKPLGTWSREMVLMEQDKKVGTICWQGMRGRIILIDLPDNIELRFKLFILSLCLAGFRACA
jgi:hypothetical protein